MKTICPLLPYRHEVPFMIAPFMALGPILRHKHEYIELGIVHAGTGIHRIFGKNYKVTRADVFVVPVGVPHSFPEVDELLTINVSIPFPNTPWKRNQYKMGELFKGLFLANDSSNYQQRRKLDETQFDHILSSCRLLFRMMEEAKTGHNSSQMLPLFVEFLNFLAEAGQVDDQNRNSGDWVVGRALAYIEKHYREELAIGMLASACGVSARSLQRKFKEHLNMGPMQYAAQLRLERAKELLHHDDLLIKEVAYYAGFSDSNYFCRLFRRTVGMTPQEYRKFRPTSD